jgi:hypothetical protein
VVATSADDPSQGVSGIDSGSITASTRYFVYAVADQDSVATHSVSFSTSASAPTGVTNSKLLGWISTDTSGSFTSGDIVNVHGANVIQSVGTVSGALATGTTDIPFDNTTPSDTEGDQYLQAIIRPLEASNFLKIDYCWYGSDSADSRLTACIFSDQDGTVDAVSCAAERKQSVQYLVGLCGSHYEKANTTNQITWSLRAGSVGAGTTSFNGEAGAVLFNKLASYLIVTEYEQ